MRYSRNSIVLVPIPFTDLSSSKVRPAVVIGLGPHHGDVFVLPITSQLQQTSHNLIHWQAAGLNVPSGIKAQLATIEERMIRKVVGKLQDADIAAVKALLRDWLSI